MDPKTQAIINELAHQRNQNADAVAMLSGVIAEQRARISELEAKLAELTPEPAPAFDPVTAQEAA